MLSTIKKFASGWVSSVFLGLLAVSFVLWGVADVFTSYGRNAVATVGDTEVTVAQFQSRYQQSINNFARGTGQVPTEAQAVQLGIPTQVLEVLISEATLTDAAADMGLGLSDETLSRQIRSDPMALGPTGQYSELALQSNLLALGMDLDDFVVTRRQEYTRNQLMDALAGGVETPQAYMRAFNEYRGESRTIEYVVVRPEPLEAIPAPGDGELEAFFAEREEDWRAPEYRSIRYVELNLDALAKPGDVTDEQVRSRYDEQILRFTTPGFRTVRQIVFDEEAEANAAAAELSAGASLDEVAEAHGASVNNLGEVTRDEIVGDAVADAVFALGAGETSGVVEGPFGFVILEVVDATIETVQPLAEVEDTLRGEIAREIAAAEIGDLSDAIEDTRAGGASLVEVAERFDLELVTPPPFDFGGSTEDGEAVTLPADDLISSAFESDVGLDNNPLRSASGGIVWYDVTAVTAPRLRTLDEIRDTVVTAWRDARRGEAAEEEAQAILTRLRSGEPLEQIAADMVLEIQVAEGVTRSGAADLSSAAVAEAFGGPEGHAAVVAGAEALESIVLTVVSVERPDFFAGSPDLEPFDQALRRQIAEGLIGVYAHEASEGREPRINQQVLASLFGDLPPVQR